MGRWVGGPDDGRVEGRDERLERGLPSSSRWSEDEEGVVVVDEDAAGPRLVRWEMRVFFGAKGSTKSKHGGRF